MTAPLEPPEPPVPVTVPVLKPAHIVEPFAGVDEPSVGDVGVVPIVQVHMVDQDEFEQSVPPVLRD